MLISSWLKVLGISEPEPEPEPLPFPVTGSLAGEVLVGEVNGELGREKNAEGKERLAMTP